MKLALNSQTVRKSRTKTHLGLYLFLGILALAMALPFYWSLMTSFKVDEDIFSIPITWFPKVFTMEHYKNAFTTVPFARYFGNSLYLATAGVLCNLFFGSLGGFAFAKLKFPGRELIFKILLSSFMVPGIVIMIPQYLMLKQFPLFGGNNLLGQGGSGLLGSYWAIILPGAAGAFAVFFMRQFFQTVPDELMEAARIDGCPEFKIFWGVYLPLVKPALAALSIFTFSAGWNSFLWPMIVLTDPKKATIQMGLQAFSFNKSVDYGAVMAGSLIAMLPMLLLFMCAQKYFIKGIAFSGLKQ